MQDVRMTLRLPKPLADFLDKEAGRHFTTRTAEIIRSVRERMEAEQTAPQ